MARWFRFGKKQEEQATQEEVATEDPTPSDVQAPEPTDEQAASTGPKKRRRRGSRGGKGRKKAPAGSAEGDEPSEATAEKTAPVTPARTKQPAKSDKRQSRAGNRRRTPTKRAPLPAAKRELVITVDVGEQRVAILEDERVAEVYLERPERRSIAGNIYLGAVDNVLPGM